MRLCSGLLLVSLVACGGDATSSGSQPPPPPPAARVVNVGMIDSAFSVPTLEVTVGTIVKWTNNGNIPHTSTSDAMPQVWNSGTVEPAGTTTCPSPPDPLYPCTPAPTPPGTYQRTFDIAGTYPYHCQFHAQRMRGTITVTP